MAVEDFVESDEFPCVVPACWEKCVEDHAFCAGHELLYIVKYGAASPLVAVDEDWYASLRGYGDAKRSGRSIL